MVGPDPPPLVWDERLRLGLMEYGPAAAGNAKPPNRSCPAGGTPILFVGPWVVLPQGLAELRLPSRLVLRGSPPRLPSEIPRATQMIVRSC